MEKLHDEQLNLPADFTARMQAELGDKYDSFIDSFDAPFYQALRVNTAKCSIGELSAITGWELASVPWSIDGYYFDEAVRPGKSPLHDAGFFYIQEPSAMSVAARAQVSPGERVLDLCAAPGGKTTALAAQLAGSGLLIANEIIKKRAAVLSQNVERMGLANTVVTNETPAALADRFPEFFDCVVVDAPCSGEGMFKKEPEAIAAWSIDTVNMCAARQRDILSYAVGMVRPGGRLIYSTCTFSREEDEDNAAWLCAKHPDFSLASEEKLWPHLVKGAGHYVAVFCKGGDSLPAVLSNRRRADKKLRLLSHLWEEWAAAYLRDFEYDPELLIAFGDNLYLLPEHIDLAGLHVERPGLHLGTLSYDRFEPSLALALSLRPEQARYVRDLSVDEASSYIAGGTLDAAEQSGWILLTVCGASLSFGKAGGGRIKNHYPKGLRHN